MFNYRQNSEDELEYLDIGPAEELVEGEPLLIDIDDQPVAVLLQEGKMYAIGDYCSHDGEPLAEGDVERTEIICPRHGARFSLETGKALSLPAVKDIPVYPVRIREGVLQIGVPKARS